MGALAAPIFSSIFIAGEKKKFLMDEVSLYYFPSYGHKSFFIV
jgi:hypothetical protein